MNDCTDCFSGPGTVCRECTQVLSKLPCNPWLLLSPSDLADLSAVFHPTEIIANLYSFGCFLSKLQEYIEKCMNPPTVFSLIRAYLSTILNNWPVRVKVCEQRDKWPNRSIETCPLRGPKDKSCFFSARLRSSISHGQLHSSAATGSFIAEWSGSQAVGSVP